MTTLSRRNFLFATLAASATAAAGTVLGSEPALAVDRAGEFTRAAARYDVPAAVLATVSYGQSRWEDHAGSPSAGGGYGPMHLVDGARAAAARRTADKTGTGVMDTLGQAATLTGYSTSTLRTDPAANIMGAAALIASVQKKLGLALGTDTDPATWYSAIAAASGLASSSAQRVFADDALQDLRRGVVRSTVGGTLRMAPRTIGTPTRQRSWLTARINQAAATTGGRPDSRIDGPRGLGIEWVEAPYEQYGPGDGDYGNHDLAHRPVTPTLDQIVIHDTECVYDEALKLVKMPTYLAWNYTFRASDGHVAQHLQANDIGWHAGNWYVNTHALGIEHEGFGAVGDETWYTEAMYRRSARLVGFLARKYRIRMDRAHILGHDQVPGVDTAHIPSQHWDPGPFWDWEHYFQLMGADLRRGTIRRPARPGEVVRILPGFDTNTQPLTGKDGDAGAGYPAGTGMNFVTLHTAPDDSSPIYTDAGLHQNGTAGSSYVSDMGGRAAAGCDYAVAAVKGDWTAIWYLGDKVWFRNPRRRPTAAVVWLGARVVTPKRGRTSIPVYGVAFPEASAYPNPEDAKELAPLIYTLKPGQAYVLHDADIPADYYKAWTYSAATPGDHVDIVGKLKYYMIGVGHRIGYVLSTDVDIRRACL
ncbi:N-acetylmuramoyl-L-alanine amidase [Acidipropionibacterium jensenii]|uniref:N-acetylmuramoyl-L-alanine amidase n=1 Tax=Acidipropionibacterium jensenii TaxID=1749 RepID=UPI00110A9490|nr:N-acetylmuramoyl-L-alanine amidase [Acidipropionibacterium jensenii]QCV88951.1 N-acetylmuramoyl-L-alanine amidase [Acidipropionibacterium jensenii]